MKFLPLAIAVVAVSAIRITDDQASAPQNLAVADASKPAVPAKKTKKSKSPARGRKAS